MDDTERLDDFYVKLNGLVSTIGALREDMKESYVVKKLLRAIPSRFLLIAATIEQFGDLETISVEVAVGSLQTHEERLKGQGEKSGNNGSGKLLTEEEWSRREKNEDKLLLTREDWMKRTGKDNSDGQSSFKGRNGRIYQNRTDENVRTQGKRS